MPARLRRQPPPDAYQASDDEVVTFKTSQGFAGPVDGEDDVSTVVGSDNEAPDAVDFAGSRQEAERLLQDLAQSRRRRDDERRARDAARQQRNRDQKLDKQRRLELELSREILDDIAADEADDGDDAPPAAARAARRRAGVVSLRPKKKRFQYPTPAVVPAELDFVPLGGAATEFRAAALPAAPRPAVVNPQLAGLRERLLYGGRTRRTSAVGLAQLRHKQAASGKYSRR